jgi:3-isopropylmalate dehydratase small subunit
MDKFTTLTGVAAPLPMINIDTDAIIPKQFLKTIKRTGLGQHLLYELRYDEQGKEKPDFVLNKPAYRKARILGLRAAQSCRISLPSPRSNLTPPTRFQSAKPRPQFLPSRERFDRFRSCSSR